MLPTKNTTKNQLFIAIKLADHMDLIRLLQNFKTSLKSENLHWTKDQNLHLTLKFIGTVSEKELDSIHLAVLAVSKKFEEITLNFDKIGLFGSAHNPRVLWLGVALNENLNALNKLLSKELSLVGIKTDVQNFVPHITLARIHRKIKSIGFFQKVIDAYKNPNLDALAISELHLFNSEINKEGPTYQIIATYPLKK